MKIRNTIVLFFLAILCIGILPKTVSAAGETEITAESTAEDVYTAFGLTADNGQAKLSVDIAAKTITLNDDISAADAVRFVGGDWTLLGCGNTITLKRGIYILGDAILRLGRDGDTDASALTLISEDNTASIFDLQGSAKLYMYNGVTAGPSKGAGRPGCADLNENAVFYMYGGEITDCTSISVAGGVYIKDDSQFHMYGGVIENCSGMEGGAVGVADGSTAIGPITGSNGLFHMHDGIIKNCFDGYEGGGAVCILSWTTDNYGQFIMDGGTITECYTADSAKYGGGAVYLSAADAKAEINGGTITGNHTDRTGGGIYIRVGTASVASGVALYNNIAGTQGDDIALGGTFTTVTLTKGTLPARLVLSGCGHEIDGWYNDTAKSRWNPSTKMPVENTSQNVTASSSVKAFKAAHDILCAIEVTPPELDFGKEDVGYTVPEAKTVTVTNKGDRSITLKQPVSEYFDVGALSQLVLGVNETATFTIQPKAGLTSGTYTDDIVVSGESLWLETESAVKTSFSVNNIVYNLTVELNGGSGTTVGGSYEAGEVISIDAGTRKNYTFTGWTTSNGGTFDNASEPSTAFTMPDADTTITATWARTQYKIISSAGQGGTVSPSGEETVSAGESRSYVITPLEGYVISDVKVDGNSVGAVETYTFEDVQSSHTIEAIFTAKTSDNPETGDNINSALSLIFMLVSVSAGGFGGVWISKRKNRKAEN